ncbi:Elongation factor Tu GTP binding domain [Trypanosoma vivax]|nr:Elongation factor Tu GTP binding domain [Trypanosoma vivax]
MIRLSPLRRAVDIIYAIPSVMEARSFAKFVRDRTAKLAHYMEAESLERNYEMRSRSFDEMTRKKIHQRLYDLLHLQEKEVEHAIWEQHGLRDERLATCIVPYRLAANIILNRLPKDLREACSNELRTEEASLNTCKLQGTCRRILQWIEKDVYVSTGVSYLKRFSTQPHSRVPVIAVLGHGQHGKTLLLDVLQGTSLHTEEARGTTQSIRAFTVPAIGESHKSVTFLDTPGQRLFVETRLHAQIFSDFLIILVSAIDGVQSQTLEVIKVALNVDKPLIVVLNKMDLFSGACRAEESVSKILSDIREAGLDVTMVRTGDDIVRLQSCTCPTDLDLNKQCPHCRLSEFFYPMKKIDPTYAGSMSKPLVNLRRGCVGVCVSAKEKRNIDLLWSVIDLMTTISAPQCLSTSADYSSHNCSVQALVLESSKHLFDEENFRMKETFQRIQKRYDRISRRRQARFEKNSVGVRLHASVNAARRKICSWNPTSTNYLVVTAIVREGCLTRGMPFVADHSGGSVDCMVDTNGNPVHHAYPGTAVTIIDFHSNAGCPGVGTHILSMPSAAARDAVSGYRQLLQMFVECFPQKLHLLRPRGMDTSFAHLGDYGQLGDAASLQYQLLYGSSRSTPLPDPSRQLNCEKLSSNAVEPHGASFGEYIMEVNSGEKGDAMDSSTSQGGSVVGILLDKEVKAMLERMWLQLQLENCPHNQRAYEEMVKSCVQIGVVFKVDSWHSARLLNREVSRLGTRKVAFHVIGIRFGELLVDDILFFGCAMKIAVCFRTPIVMSTELDQYIEANDTWVLHTDDISDVVLFLKWCAVALHREHAPDDFGVVEQNRKGHFAVLDAALREASNGSTSVHKNVRRRRLLLTPSL